MEQTTDITINLPEDLRKTLTSRASELGVSIEEYILQLLIDRPVRKPIAKIENPWSRLPLDGRLILPEDAADIDEFNASVREEFQIHTEFLPEPYLGNPNASVFLLNLNPGYNEGDLVHHRNPHFASLSRANLNHDPVKYPFYLLNPDVSEAPGHGWWSHHLKCLINELGVEAVARNVFNVEYFPYHTSRFKSGCEILHSQNYSFWLVQAAIERNAVIIVMRSGERWFDAVPGLRGYRNLFKVSNPQNPSISPKNCPEGYERAISAIKQHSSETGIS